MKKELPQEWINQRDAMKLEWIKNGCSGSFYEWMLDRIESRMKNA